MSPFFYIGINSFHMVSHYQEPVTVSHLIPGFICLQEGCGDSMEKKKKPFIALETGFTFQQILLPTCDVI